MRGEPYPALLSYARALRSDRNIFGKKILIERIEALAGEIEFHKLRSATGRFAGTPAGMFLQAALAEREQQEKTDKTARAEAPPPEKAEEPASPPEVNAGRVGVMLPLSGALGVAGGRVYDGIRLALRHSLAKYPGLRVQLAVRDSKSAAGSAGGAAEVAAELIEKERAIALIGPLITEAADSAAGVANRLKTPMLTPFALRMRMNPDFPWVFRNSLPNRLQARGVAAYAIGQMGLRRFAVLYPAERDGIELTDAFTQAVENLGGEVVKIVSFPENATDFREQMLGLGGMDDRRLNRRRRSLGLKGTDPYQIPLNFEALFVPVRHEEAVLIAPQLFFYNMARGPAPGRQRMERPPPARTRGALRGGRNLRRRVFPKLGGARRHAFRERVQAHLRPHAGHLLGPGLRRGANHLLGLSGGGEDARGREAISRRSPGLRGRHGPDGHGGGWRRVAPVVRALGGQEKNPPSSDGDAAQEVREHVPRRGMARGRAAPPWSRTPRRSEGRGSRNIRGLSNNP